MPYETIRKFLSNRDKVSSCYGYGISMSALQIAQAYQVFANKGVFKELNLFFDNGVVVEILNDNILNIKELKVKNINQIYFQKNILFTSHLNGKSTIF